MSSKYDAAAAAAGWKPHPRNRKENRDFMEHMPELSLRVWCELDGVHLLAYVRRLDDLGKLHVTDIAQAIWKPGQATEVSVVDWGRRALSHWLEEQLIAAEV